MANFTAQQIYSVVSPYQLTAEQSAAIESASLTAPALVIAGAGSGKTELMMVRVLYLVANGFARPDQILGLTFTKKAASELAARVQQGLIQLRESEYWPADLEQDFLPAKIATYNSFGNEIFRSMALELGYEPDSQLIREADAMQLALEIVDDHASYEELPFAAETVAERLLQLSAEMTEHLVQPAELVSHYQELSEILADLPKTDKGDQGRFSYTEKHLGALAQARLLVELAQKFREEKRRRSLLDFADQVALSLQGARNSGLELDYRFVLLDEYQDTSPIQTQLLAKLFFEKPVMAVGDPNQSIYSWRGASSANLSNFFEDFGPGDSFTLSTSWRSGAKILEVANQIAQNIPHRGVQSVTLSAGREIESSVQAGIFQDQISEAEAVCDWLSAQLTQDKSAAILFRTKESMRTYSDALTARGITHEITGLSALLEQPEVVDLVALLRVLVDPGATVELIRLLTGAKYRVGPVEIAKLHRLAQQLGYSRAEVERDKPITLVELIDELDNPKVSGKGNFEPAALERMRALAHLVRQMRQQLSLSVSEIATLAIRELDLDIELFAHSDATNPMANLQAFLARISEYEESSSRSSLADFVRWLDRAQNLELFELPRGYAKRGVVQLMSVHAAKGLEWDIVAIPNLNGGSFPLAPRDSLAWLSGSKLPPSFRLDARELPRFSESFESQRDFNQALDTFKELQNENQFAEERRLAYVGFTRAAERLLLSASYFKPSAMGSREISPFLQELIDADLVEMLSLVEPGERPEFARATDSWPKDPLGTRREVWMQAAQQVTQAKAVSAEEIRELSLLLLERELRHAPSEIELPLRLSASAIVQLLTDPESFFERLARPLPSGFSEAAEIGTTFHARLESAFLSGSELEISSWSEPEQKLGVNFQSSRFANLKPHLVEQSVEFNLAGTVVVCKLDAVFFDGSEYTIVDWKSGKAPIDEEDLRNRAIQLALYRIGLGRLLNSPPERIRAVFFFAGDGQEIAPELIAEKDLADLLVKARTARQNR